LRQALFTKLIGFYLLADKRLVIAIVSKVVTRRNLEKNEGSHGGIARITETRDSLLENVSFLFAPVNQFN